MNDKIYVVTAGCYSDYRIVSATTKYDTAVALKEKFSNEYKDTRIEEYDDGYSELMLKPLWYIKFNLDGTVLEYAQTIGLYCYCYGLKECLTDVNGCVYMHVIADTAEAAIKIGAERRAQFLNGSLIRKVDIYVF